ncbi:MAG TPA: phosphodiester glycosidase family protein [Pseudonocardiaceae bacterium]|nr:phosphodiester glycosidase family protein [Pseudonocardiaceae bacterium]
MAQHRIRPDMTLWVRRARRCVLAGFVAFVVLVTWSIGGVLTAPGTDSAAARLAEWARDHSMSDLVTYLEQLQYQHNQPKVGGLPTGSIPVAAGAVPSTSTPATPTAPSTRAGGRGLPMPATIPDLAGGAPLPGEGLWQTVAAVRGQPAVRVAMVRPDTQHTSYLAGALWLDPTLVRGQLRPGFQDPGGSWQAATSLTAADQRSVVAAFNAGFRLTNNASHGGYYSEGRTVLPLVDGAASLVLRTDGTAEVGAWNQEVRMSAAVASVRQNLVMLVDNGKVNPTCQTGGNAEWGSTVGQAAYIDRSGFGITADGAEVYVGGPALSVCTLGNILRAAGVVRGMELDINPDWISGAYFHTTPTGARGYRLYPGQKVPPQHYLSPSSRDWYAWFARS